MSITHSLMISTEMTPPQVREWLLNSRIGLEPDGDEDMRGEGVRVYTGSTSGLRQEVVLEDYGVLANFCIYFRRKSDEDTEEGKRIIGRTVAAFLTREKGDAVLLYVSEIPILRRVGGRVVISDERNEYGAWLTPPLDAAGIKYERAESFAPAA